MIIYSENNLDTICSSAKSPRAPLFPQNSYESLPNTPAKLQKGAPRPFPRAARSENKYFFAIPPQVQLGAL